MKFQDQMKAKQLGKLFPAYFVVCGMCIITEWLHGYGEGSEQLPHLVSMGTVFTFHKCWSASSTNFRQLVKLFTTRIQYNTMQIYCQCVEKFAFWLIFYTHTHTHTHTHTQMKIRRHFTIKHSTIQ